MQMAGRRGVYKSRGKHQPRNFASISCRRLHFVGVTGRVTFRSQKDIGMLINEDEGVAFLRIDYRLGCRRQELEISCRLCWWRVDPGIGIKIKGNYGWKVHHALAGLLSEYRLRVWHHNLYSI